MKAILVPAGKQHLGLGAAPGGEEVAAVDHRRGHRPVVDHRAGARPPGRAGVRLEEVGGLVAHELEGVAALDIGDALGGEPFQLDGLDLRAVLLALARALRLLVAVEAAVDAVGGAVEEVDERPEQVVEVGFEPGVAEHAGEGVEDVGEAGPDHLVVGQRPRIGLVLMRTVAVQLQFEDDAVGRRGGVVGLVARRRREARRSWRVSVGCGRAHRGLTAKPGRAPGAAAPKAGAKRRTAQPLRPRPGGGRDRLSGRPRARPLRWTAAMPAGFR